MSVSVPSREDLDNFVLLLRRYSAASRTAFEHDRIRGEGWTYNPYIALSEIQGEVIKASNRLDFLCPFGWPKDFAEKLWKIRDPRFGLHYHVSRFIDRISGEFDLHRAEAKLDELDKLIDEIGKLVEEELRAWPVGASEPQSPTTHESAEVKNPYFDFETIGQLLRNLESSERAYQANMQQADRTEAKSGSVVAWHTRLQAQILRFQLDPKRMPGIDAIVALVNEEWGTPLTSEAVRKLRGRLCRILKKPLEAINSLTMAEAAEHLTRESVGSEEPNATQPVNPSTDMVTEPLTDQKTPKRGNPDRETIALYRKIVGTGNKMTHGNRGKRVELAKTFKSEIAQLAPNVEPRVFVHNAYGYCYKHPSRSHRT